MRFRPTFFSSFMRAHAQAMNEYRGGEMSTEVVVDRICRRKLWTVDGSKSVLRAWLYCRTFNFRVHGPSSRPVPTFFFNFSFLFFSFFFNLKLPIMPFSYFVIQFNIKKHEKNMVELLDCLILLSITWTRGSLSLYSWYAWDQGQIPNMAVTGPNR